MTLSEDAKAERERWRAAVMRRIAQHREDLKSWQEPGGLLLPTEPDPDERRLIRDRLTTAIQELVLLADELNVLVEPKWSRR